MDKHSSNSRKGPSINSASGRTSLVSHEYSDSDTDDTRIRYISLRRLPDVQPSYALKRCLYAMKRGRVVRIGRFTVRTLTTLDLIVESAVFRLNHDYVFRNTPMKRRTSNTYSHIEYNDLALEDYMPTVTGSPVPHHLGARDVDEYLDRSRHKVVHIVKQAGCLLGFSIAENSNDVMRTVYVCGITPSGAAAKFAELQVGDKLISINGKSVVGLTTEETHQKLLDTRPLTDVRLSVVYSPLVCEYELERIVPHSPLGLQVTRGVIVRVPAGGLAYRKGVRTNHVITKIQDGELEYTQMTDIIRVLHSFVGPIRLYTMAVSVFNSVGKQALTV